AEQVGLAEGGEVDRHAQEVVEGRGGHRATASAGSAAGAASGTGATGISKVGAACSRSLPGMGLRISRLNASRSRNMPQTASCIMAGCPLNTWVSRPRKDSYSTLKARTASAI